MSPAVRGWHVCRMHGARGGAPTGAANGAWRHGERTGESEQILRELKRLMDLAQDGLNTLTR
ncbi:hypothetical protein [Puniceibacterium confluentis]|uniref:hypothetical protein n=1 Tax=Puniceibacterium confluentis TaxID=1958944 RepID=UPI0011B4B8D3|nr:hypothetical protein [Puniceibacterium confluentis]